VQSVRPHGNSCPLWDVRERLVVRTTWRALSGTSIPTFDPTLLLNRVGVLRSQLFEGSATRQRFRAHDLRTTFVTIALATGKTETWVSDRTGHDGHSMIERYRREARTWNLGELGHLYALIPELAEAEPTVRIRPGLPLRFTARVAKLADAADLGSAAARRRGSTPLPCTFEELPRAAELVRAQFSNLLPRVLPRAWQQPRGCSRPPRSVLRRVRAIDEHRARRSAASQGTYAQCGP
jgi:hypothetical protein